ncbi:GAP1-N2 domain-containing protein [Anatilimnocola floriformis]|uniref:GAP1-N2 domain-containing protein n=1 Tax=Anatilimnocola floriformis TaxID=2948575 RepID=UPI0020C49B41|nr:hypothetical protein [Anatilimnocola floriformis]
MPNRVEQAIFTSIRGKRMAGYQLTSRSGGIDDDVAQQLSNWGPAHDSLESRLGRNSVNVFPIDEQQLCISYTQLAGAEYSGRAGGRVYTHCFVIDRDALAPFQFNPFPVLRAFRSAGRTQPRRDPPPTLDSFELVGRSSNGASNTRVAVHTLLAEDICEKLMWALAAGQPVYLAGDAALDTAVEAVLQLLDDDRAEVSFTTGLRISPRRSFQLQAVPNDAVLLRQLQRNEHAVVVQLPVQTSSPTRDTNTISGTRLF